MSIPFSKVSMGREEEEAVLRVMRSGWLAAGPETEAFEKEFSTYISPPGEKYYCIFTNSCTSALKLSYTIAKELGVKGIYYPRNTFVATYGPAAELGLAILPLGGYDGDIWRLCPLTSAQDAASLSMIRTTATEENSAASIATGKAEKEFESLHIPNSRRATIPAQPPSSKRHPDQITQVPGNTESSTNGLNGLTDRRMSAMNAGQLAEWLGQTRTTDIPENVINGRDYARGAITSTMPLTMASTVVHYSSIRDNSPCLIEDSAHRIESNDPLTGLMRCYSFYATKNMTTGSGGMFVTSNKWVYERARLYWKDGLTTSTRDRNAGAKDYEVKALASSFDGNDLAAAIGRVQLRRLPELSARRNAVRDRYNDAFGVEWLGNHLLPVFVRTPEGVAGLRRFLFESGIGSGYHYPGSGWLGVSLPIYPDLTEEDQLYVIEKVKQWYAAHPAERP